MKMKKLGACALALATAAAICSPAAAFADATITGDAVTTVGGAKESVITGTIEATKLSISVPTAAAFTIDPTIAATDDVDGTISQLTNVPTNYTLTNKSAVPVYAYISGCTIAAAGATTGTPTLVSATSGLSADKAVMFAVKDSTSAPKDFKTADDWLSTTPGKYYAFNAADKGKLADKTANDKSNEATMSFYGQTTTGWSHGDSFTIKPTFTIAVTQPAN